MPAVPLQTETDFKRELSSAIFAYSGTRIFHKNPLKDQTDSYAVYFLPVLQRLMASQEEVITVRFYSKSSVTLANMYMAAIEHFEDRRYLNSNHYFSISLIGKSETPERLDNGFYFATLNFRVRKVV